MLTERGRWASTLLDERGRSINGSLTEQGRLVVGDAGGTGTPMSYDYATEQTIYEAVSTAYATEQIIDEFNFYLSMDGINDQLTTPAFQYNKVVIEMLIDGDDPGTRVLYDGNVVGSGSSKTVRIISDDTIDFDSTSYSLLIAGVTPISDGDSPTMDIKLPEITINLDDGSVINTASFFSAKNGSFAAGGHIYDIKMYNDSTLRAHYDMSTGTVLDQSGNGRDATLTGGTWVVVSTPVSYEYATEQTIYSDMTTPYATEQTIYSDTTTAYATQQRWYTSVSYAYATEQIMDTNLFSASYATRQNISGIMSWDYATLQKSYDSELQAYATLQALYDTFTSDHSTLQTIYENVSSGLATLQITYSVLSTLYSTEQVLYEVSTSDYSTLQALYESVSTDFATLQQMIPLYEQSVSFDATVTRAISVDATTTRSLEFITTI